jgi:hypothetical protein
MLTYEAACKAPPERAWELVSRPDRWSSWAPHIRGAWGLGSPQVEAGARGAARPFGIVPVMRMTYGPVLALLARNLARVAEREA